MSPDAAPGEPPAPAGDRGVELSVVVVTRDTVRTLRPILTALAEQTVASSLEILIVAPDRDAGEPEAELADAFADVRVVPVGSIQNRGRAAAGGVRAATAPVVALSENHCFPDPDWAETTIRLHRETGCDGLGPAVVNANPETTLSVCMHTAGYGRFAAGGRAESREELPLHNSSFLREALLELDTDLEHLLADERRLHRELVARGRDLRFEPGVVKRHINEATWRLLLGLAWTGGRRYGELRARDWTLPRRLAYAAAAPLLTIPIARRQRELLPPEGSGGSNAQGSTGSSPAGRNAEGLPVHAEGPPVHAEGLPVHAEGPPVRLVQVIWALSHALGEAASYLFGSPQDFPFVERDEFMIRERLGTPLEDPRIRRLVDRLDD